MFVLVVFGSLSTQLYAEIGLVTDEDTLKYIQEQKRILAHQKQMLQSQTLLNKQEQSVELKETVAPTIKDEAFVADSTLPTFTISTINVTGATLLNYKKLSLLKKAYEGRDLSIQDIKQLSKKIVNSYMKKGYITTRVSLPKQNLSEGTLRLTVVEGRVGRIYSLDETISKQEIFMAFPYEEGSVLQLKDLEQGLEQLNKNRSKSVRFSLLPSAYQGFTDIQIQNSSTLNPGVVSLQYNNYGLFKKGFEPDGISVLLENKLKLNERLDLYFTQNNGTIGQSSLSRSASLQIPYGFLTHTFSYSETDYHNRFHSSHRVINTSGKTYNRSGGISAVLTRGQTYMGLLNMTLNSQQVDSMVEDVFNDVGSSHLSVVRVGLSGFKRYGFGQFQTELTHHQGIATLGSNRDEPELSNADYHSQFQKWTSSLTYSHAVFALNRPIYLSSYVAAQYSQTALYSSEEMSIGGVYTVRGTSDILNGEKGLRFRNDLTLPSKSKRKLLKGASYLMSLDGGYVITKDRYAAIKRGGAVGASVGMAWALPHTSINVSYGFPVKLSRALQKSESKVYASMTLSF